MKGDGMLTRGQLAQRTGVHAETIRHYERVGLLAPEARDKHGVRGYARGAIPRLELIREARRLGFGLAEIRGLLDEGGPLVQSLDRRLQALQALRERVVKIEPAN
jgi:DNA-binding transcriptional MerR regulator